MKKLLLLAMLLGLTGCGDNNQSDTQTNTQANTLQKTEAALAVANYSLAASPRAMSAVAPLQGWDVLGKTILGSETLIDASKGNVISAALVTPNAKQVAEVLRGGAAGIALSLAVDQLLDAVDWVMDPANNQIKYKVFTCPEGSGQTLSCPYYINNFQEKGSFETVEAAGTYYFNTWEYQFDSVNCKNINNETWACGMLNGRNKYGYAVGNVTIDIRKHFESNQVEKTLPLETVSEQVISNADAGSLDAQVATNIAAQNILNDVVQAEPVVQELENNAKNNCPSGIIKNGSCWVCEKEQYYPMSRATRDAKTATRGKSCKDVTDTTIKAANAILFRNLINARVQENACWSPPDPNHAIALVDAQNALSLCEN